MSRPNVVFLVMDTARENDVLGAGGNEPIAPQLERIGRSGSVYERVFAQAPWTLPSHASLFTGTHSSKHGAHADHKRLENRPTTLAEVLAANDYETVAVSNNTWISEEFGFDHGFETFHKTWQYVQSETDLGKVARTEEGIGKFRALASELTEGNPLVNLANAFYGQFLRKQNDDGAKQTNEWIEDWLGTRDSSQSFFLFVNYLEPHLEYRPPEAHAERFLPDDVSYDDAMAVSQDAWGYIAGKQSLSDRDFEILRALYRAEIAYLDERIGEVKDALVAAGEWEDTIFIVTGDHGENIGDHGLMDHQYALYDTLLHVPLIVHGGAFTESGIDDRLVQLTDIAPTILDEVGIDAPEFRAQMQGQSFHPAADTEPRERVMAEYMAPQPSMDAIERRVGDLPEHVYEFDRSLRAIRTEKWKFIRGSDGSTELFDVESDPEESEDRSGDHPDIVAGLQQDLDDWLDSFDHAETNDDVEMHEDTKERLEDLGYLQ